VALYKGRSYGLLAPSKRDYQLSSQDTTEAGVVERRQDAALREKDNLVSVSPAVPDRSELRAVEVAEGAGDPPRQLGL
jgi:hypothetical protein